MNRIGEAAQALARGELVAFPTETVYGLGARADDDAAVARIFALKGRPADHPLIVHVADRRHAERFAAAVPASAQRLMDAFWPGPVTVIVPRRPDIARACAGGQDSIGLRCPQHPLALQLLQQAHDQGVAGVAAPSANRFGRISPTSAEHVRSEFGVSVRVLDGGECAVGIESAIVDCTGDQPRLLRPGTVSVARLEQALGQSLGERTEQSPRASGTLESHYAPVAKLRVWEARQLVEQWEALVRQSGAAPAVAVYSRLPPGGGVAVDAWRPLPADPMAAAHDLFAGLRALDAAVSGRPGAEIWVEQFPDGPEWAGVRDRVARAAA